MFLIGSHSDPDEPLRKQTKLDTETAAPSASAAGEATAADKAKAAAAASEEGIGEIEETLLCSICQELLHDCVRFVSLMRFVFVCCVI